MLSLQAYLVTLRLNLKAKNYLANYSTTQIKNVQHPLFVAGGSGYVVSALYFRPGGCCFEAGL